MTALASKLPKGEANGLAALSRAFIDEPESVHVVVALIDCSKITTTVESGDVVPTARIRRIEAIEADEDRQAAVAMLQRALEERTGVLPLGLDEELRAAFRGSEVTVTVDRDTGEIVDQGDE